MKNGILGDDEGYDILVNGTQRSFRDVKQTAIEAAKLIRQRRARRARQMRDGCRQTPRAVLTTLSRQL
jgi:hypothetical protein